MPWQWAAKSQAKASLSSNYRGLMKPESPHAVLNHHFYMSFGQTDGTPLSLISPLAKWIIKWPASLECNLVRVQKIISKHEPGSSTSLGLLYDCCTHILADAEVMFCIRPRTFYSLNVQPIHLCYAPTKLHPSRLLDWYKPAFHLSSISIVVCFPWCFFRWPWSSIMYSVWSRQSV